MGRGILVLVLAAVLPAAGQTPLPVSPSARADSLRADSTAVSRSDTTIIIKHHFNHRQQIITGAVVMGCLATIMVVMNNYNPQGLQR
jgi:hypothetical protein